MFFLFWLTLFVHTFGTKNGVRSWTLSYAGMSISKKCKAWVCMATFPRLTLIHTDSHVTHVTSICNVYFLCCNNYVCVLFNLTFHVELCTYLGWYGPCRSEMEEMASTNGSPVRGYITWVFPPLLKKHNEIIYIVKLRFDDKYNSWSIFRWYAMSCLNFKGNIKHQKPVILQFTISSAVMILTEVKNLTIMTKTFCLLLNHELDFVWTGQVLRL